MIANTDKWLKPSSDENSGLMRLHITLTKINPTTQEQTLLSKDVLLTPANTVVIEEGSAGFVLRCAW